MLYHIWVCTVCQFPILETLDTSGFLLEADDKLGFAFHKTHARLLGYILLMYLCLS